MENLNLCQNLEELRLRCIKLENSTFEHIMTLPRLKRLVLLGGTFPESKSYNLSHVEPKITSNLKYLILSYNHENYSSFNLGFASIKFPLLERFCVFTACDSIFNIQILCQFIANSPKLKTIQLHGRSFFDESYKNLSIQVCKERNIFITFGSFTEEVPSWSKSFKKLEKFQNDFENMMETKEAIIKTKYDDMKEKFLIWIKMNDWWKWETEWR